LLLQVNTQRQASVPCTLGGNGTSQLQAAAAAAAAPQQLQHSQPLPFLQQQQQQQQNDMWRHIKEGSNSSSFLGQGVCVHTFA
jgi:hypothetical protein